ncbi:MAG TPA: gliding motility-associated C-terminal domain-containing protein, partial [Bacteroidia bacterium]|nr:gliding motility-associated C-terminal domain-containing protein [Bacteroidia bacterium]
MSGFNGLDTFFVKLFNSQGSCLSLVPLICQSSTTGFLQTTFLTPEVGGEYYLQIGGGDYDETGDFNFFLKSFNECSDCVRNAKVELSPAPWFGRYSTQDTVEMCVTVDRWDQSTTSKLHSIIPIFGDDWDTSTLTPITVPGTAGSGWGWFNNVNIPAGTVNGFFVDNNFDGDPTNNPGDGGNLLTTWTGCWSIVSRPFCNTFDLSVDVYVRSDNETGSGNASVLCTEYIPIQMEIAGWCCPSPFINITPSAGCANFSSVFIDPSSSNSTDSFTVSVYDTAMNVYTYSSAFVGSVMYTVATGEYIVEVYNITDGCIAFETITVGSALTADLTQVTVGCGPGTSGVIATPVGGTGPFTYMWTNIPQTNWTDSSAYNLDQGYAVVLITDALGCTVVDSIFVTTLPLPGAEFYYSDMTYCHNDDTLQPLYDPYTPGGTFTLVGPTTSSITVDPVTGIISLNGSTLTAPYWIYVQYAVGSVCTATWIDSVQIVQQPSPPTAVTPTSVDWCIGSGVPVLTIAMASGIPFWYDVQTTQSGIGYSFSPGLTSSSSPGLYLYGFVYLTDLAGGCTSLPTVFTVNAIPQPNMTMSLDTTICEGDVAAISAVGSGTYQYSWTPQPTVGSANLPFTTTSPTTTTTYTCTVSDGACTRSGTVKVTVLSSADCGFLVYNGITPNGDGLNDTWVIDGADQMPGLTVTIYNRWGGVVWKKENYDNTTVVWTGEDEQGNDLPSGTYYYTIEQTGRVSENGWVELNR